MLNRRHATKRSSYVCKNARSINKACFQARFFHLREELKAGSQEYSGDTEDSNYQYQKSKLKSMILVQNPNLDKKDLKKTSFNQLLKLYHKKSRIVINDDIHSKAAYRDRKKLQRLFCKDAARRFGGGKNPVYSTDKYVELERRMMKVMYVLNNGKMYCTCIAECCCYEFCQIYYDNEEKCKEMLDIFDQKYGDTIDIRLEQPTKIIQWFCKCKILGFKYDRLKVSLISSKVPEESRRVRL